MTTKKISYKVKSSENYKMFSYTGSKHKFQSQFHKVINKIDTETIDVKYYIEGFSGSLMSMFHNLQKINCEFLVINDLNEKLINLYIQIKNNPKLVYEGYKMIEDKFNSLIGENYPKVRVYPKERRDEIRQNEEFYKYIREMVNTSELDWCHSSCMLFVLNHNFNGLYNENKKGHMNVSFNWSTRLINTDNIKNSLFNLSELLNSQSVIFETLDIDSLISKYNDQDTFIYLDPPYINTNIQYNKTRKKENSFTHVKTHKKLLNSCNKYKYVMYSNNHNDEFISLSDGYINFDRTHTVSNKKTTKPKQEILSYKVNYKVPVNNDDYKKYLPVSYIPKKSEVNNKDYNPVDNDYSISIGTCFSGLGCPEYVLKKLNVPHTSEFVCDIDKFCRETLIKNYNPKMVFEDIKELTIEKLLNNVVDLYIWGFPCQNFSMSSTSSKLGRQGLEGKTGVLYWDGYRILKDLNPKYSVIENVKGLVNHDKGNTFKVIMKSLEELGNYNIYHKVINPIPIGGNTNRERIFIVLIRKDVDIEFNFPEPIKSTRCIKDSLIKGDYKYLNKNEYIPWEKPIDQQNCYLKKEFSILKGTRQETKRVFHIKSPCPTIQRSGIVHINDGKGVRLLSPQELKRIQGFGDDLDMSHLSKTQMLSQLGNTMEVETMKHLIGEIVRIDKLHKSETQEELLLVS